MSDAAVRFAEAIGYASAGTAEFMLAGRDFYLLELNGRIQVEHPVTELVTGVDLVAAQLRIAGGEPLSQVTVCYKPGRRFWSGSEASNSLLLSGHAVEVRLYAEDPRTFLPRRDGSSGCAFRPGSAWTRASRRATRSASATTR